MRGSGRKRSVREWTGRDEKEEIEREEAKLGGYHKHAYYQVYGNEMFEGERYLRRHTIAR